MSELKASKNITKLQQNIEKGLQDIILVKDSTEASAAAFYLMGKALNDSGNFAYAEKYYQRAKELYEQEGEPYYVAEAKLIKLHAQYGRTEKVSEGLSSLIDNYEKIDHKPAVAKEIKEALGYYDLKKFPIQLDKILTTCLEHLNSNPVPAVQSTVKMSDIVILDDHIKANLDEILTSQPSELARTLANTGGVKDYLTRIFSEMNLKISKLENETDSNLKKLTQDLNKKPSHEDLETLANKTKTQINDVYKHSKGEASKLKEIILRVEENAASKEDVNYINEQLEATDAKTSDGAQQLLVLRNMVYTIENKAETLNLNLSILEKTIDTKTEQLSKTIQEKSKEIHTILETKANQEDLEYVNSELEEISSGRYDDTQKIKMLDQLVVNLEQKAQLHELTVTEFKKQVESELIELSRGVKNIEIANNLTPNDIAKLITDAEKHSKLITELSSNVQKIGEVVDPSIREFMQDYQEQRLALDNIMKITQEYKNKNASISKEEIAKMLSEELGKVKSEFGSEIKQINDALTRTEVYKRAELSKTFEELSNNEAIYAKSFAISLCGYFKVYSEAKQGLFQVNEDQLTPDWLSAGIKSIPVIGNTLDSINTYANKIYGAVDTMTKEQKVAKIDEIVTQHFVVNDLKLYTQEVALAMLQNREVQKALKTNDDSGSSSNTTTGLFQRAQEAYEQFKKVKDNMDAYVASLKQQALGVDTVDANFSSISAIALEHVCVFMEALCKLNEDSNGTSILPKAEKLKEFVNTQVLVLTTTVNSQGSSQVPTDAPEASIQSEDTKQDNTENKANNNNKKWTIFNLTGIKYDNELLNHPDMLAELANRLDNINKAIDLSAKVSPSLMSQAIQEYNTDLLLGAIMSLDTEI